MKTNECNVIESIDAQWRTCVSLIDQSSNQSHQVSFRERRERGRVEEPVVVTSCLAGWPGRLRIPSFNKPSPQYRAMFLL